MGYPLESKMNLGGGGGHNGVGPPPPPSGAYTRSNRENRVIPTPINVNTMGIRNSGLATTISATEAIQPVAAVKTSVMVDSRAAMVMVPVSAIAVSIFASPFK